MSPVRARSPASASQALRGPTRRPRREAVSGRSPRSAGSPSAPDQRPPQPQPMASNARTTMPPSTAIPGRYGLRRRYGRLARCDVVPVGVDVRVLDRVEVDRAAVRVLRPARRAVDGPAVERGRVVGLDRAEVAAAVGVDGDHPADREARRVEAPEHREHVRARRRGGRRSGPCARGRRSPSGVARTRRRSSSGTGHPGRHETPVMVSRSAAGSGVTGRGRPAAGAAERRRDAHDCERQDRGETSASTANGSPAAAAQAAVATATAGAFRDLPRRRRGSSRRIRLRRILLGEQDRGGRISNRRPPAPKAGALPG